MLGPSTGSLIYDTVLSDEGSIQAGKQSRDQRSEENTADSLLCLF